MIAQGKKTMVAHGGINWCWFTEFTVNPDDTVTIHRHFRLHKYDYRSDGQPWPQDCVNAIPATMENETHESKSCS